MINIKAIAALICIAGFRGLGMAAKYYRLQSENWKKEAGRLAETCRQQAQQHSLAELDKRHTEKLNEAEQENNALRTELTSGARRMYLAGKCTCHHFLQVSQAK